MPDASEAPNDVARIAQLERAQARLTAICVFLLLGLGLAIAWHIIPRRSVDAGRFVLRDDTGRKRAELGFWDDRPILRLNGENEKARAFMFVRKDGSTVLRMTDTTGTSRLALSLSAGGEPEVMLAAADGHSRLVLSAPGGSARASLRDERGTVLWSAP